MTKPHKPCRKPGLSVSHTLAIDSLAAERYVLKEMTEEERDAYEEHFFSCVACAEEVRAAEQWRISTRALLKAEIRKEQAKYRPFTVRGVLLRLKRLCRGLISTITKTH